MKLIIKIMRHYDGVIYNAYGIIIVSKCTIIKIIFFNKSIYLFLFMFSLINTCSSFFLLESLKNTKNFKKPMKDEARQKTLVFHL